VEKQPWKTKRSRRSGMAFVEKATKKIKTP
jgi:hypothetical protein